MKTTNKILTLGHVGMGTGTVAPFDQVFQKGRFVRPEDIRAGSIDCLVIWGGADISPSLYNEPAHPLCYAGDQPSFRDVEEVKAIKAAIEMNIPIIGICRGAQLLCAMAGGKLVQDVQNHGTTHDMTTVCGRTMKTSSVHHQMMYPFMMNANDWELIAWSTQPRSREYHGVDPEPMKYAAPEGFLYEPEIVYFPRIRGLAIQGHPEFMDRDCEFVEYCMDLVNQYLLDADGVGGA